MPLAWAAKLQGSPLPERVAGSSMLSHLAARAAIERRSLYLLGGSERANQGAADLFSERHPDLVICGRSTPVFSSPPTPDEVAHLRDELTELQPDLLLVALGAPSAPAGDLDGRHRHQPELRHGRGQACPRLDATHGSRMDPPNGARATPLGAPLLARGSAFCAAPVPVGVARPLQG
jgi:exopolysaccharide biosynthesis WecB/TagA/CpsF family protein